MTADRNDWKGDLAELFAERRRARGRVYAMRRLLGDLVSLATPRAQIGTVSQDVRHALRLFRKHAVIVGITVTGLGLAIAMSTTVFSVLNATLLRPFEMDDPATIVNVQRVFQRGTSTSWPYSAFAELHQRTSAAAVEASLSDTVQLESVANIAAAKPEPILFVSGGYLGMLGGRAILGRTLGPGDDRPGAAPVVVLNHSLWMNKFNGDPAIIGRTLRLSGGTVTVAGVLRPKFSGPVDQPPSFWAPFAAYSTLYSGGAITSTSQVQVDIVARIPAGAVSAAQAQLSSVASGLPPAGFDGTENVPEETTGVQFESAASRISGPDAAGVYIVIVIIFVVVGLVLALACANVANLLLAGASSRAREFGVRVAMGASRQRLLRQLLSESLLMGAGAGVLGFLLSLWLVPTLSRVVGLSSSYEIEPDLTVVAFTTMIALASGLGAGLAPARYGARGDVSGILKAQTLQSGSSPKASRMRRGFIAFQAAASMLLLVTAALFLRAALHITQTDVGFDAGKLVAVTVAFPQTSADAAGEEIRIASFWRSAIERISAMPSVERASLALYPPFGGAVAITNLTHGGSSYTIFDNFTDAAYFKTAGLRVVRGRAYTPEEVAGRARVALISESLARDFFPDVEPVGASLAPVAVAGGSGITIIGVVADAVVSRERGGGSGTTYRPIAPDTLKAARLVVRSSEPDSTARDVEAALVAIDAGVRPKSSIVRLDVEKFRNEPRVLAGLSGSVALLALVLSVLGIFGVTSFVVGQRTQEVSVRMAIGASEGDVIRLLVRQNMWPVVGGLGIGLGIALLGSRVLTAALSGISPYDPLAIIPAVAVLAATALAAVFVPALRAARTDPASVLRQ